MPRTTSCSICSLREEAASLINRNPPMTTSRHGSLRNDLDGSLGGDLQKARVYWHTMQAPLALLMDYYSGMIRYPGRNPSITWFIGFTIIYDSHLPTNFIEIIATMLPSLRALISFLIFFFSLSSAIEESTSHKTRPWTVGQAVDTTSGTIIGHAAPNALNVSEYLGIRYAESPVGELRFAAPKAYRSNATFTAANFVSLITMSPNGMLLNCLVPVR